MKQKLNTLDLEFLFTYYDDLRSDHFEARTKFKKFILSLRIKHLKKIIDKAVSKGEPLPYLFIVFV